MRFPEPMESAFLRERVRIMLTQWRFAVAFGGILYIAWAVWDWVMVPNWATQIALIRFGLVLPTLAICLGLTYLEPMQRPARIQTILSIVILVAAIGILLMQVMTGVSGGFTDYYPDLMLIQAFAYTFLRLQFVYPTVVGWTICAAFVGLSLLDSRISAEYIFYSCFYLVSANVIGMFACYYIERTQRNEYLLQRENLDLLARLTAQTDAAERARGEAVQARVRAERASADKTRFLAAASHDLKQPMHALGLWVRNLRTAARRGDAVDVSEKIQTVEDSIHAMANTFDGILQISRLDAGAIVPRIEDVEINRLLEQVELVFRPLASEKGLSFTVSQREAMPFCARTDAVLLDRVLKNLVANAVKFTDAGSVRVETRTENGAIRIEVVDTGRGIAPQHHDDIFREFFQVGNTERDRSKGLGLGLSIVRRIVDGLEGHSLEFRSDPGAGSRFSVALPASQIRPRGALKADAAAAVSRLANLYVLLIEDDRAVREGMARLLLDWGSLVDCAPGREDALRIVGENERRPDLIITDLRLPDGASGVDVAVQIRETAKRAIPVLVMTGDTASGSDLGALTAPSRLVAKPVNPDYLQSVIGDLVEERSRSAAP